MSEISRLALQIKKAPPEIGITTGTVISASPLKVRISTNIVIGYPRLYYAAGLSFDVGDSVIVCASTGNQLFYLLGKAVQA